MSTLNQCENDEPQDCEEICKADDPIEIQCSYDGKLITTLVGEIYISFNNESHLKETVKLKYFEKHIDTKRRTLFHRHS